MKEKMKTHKKQGNWSQYTSRTSLNIYSHHQIIEIFSKKIEGFGEDVIKPLKAMRRWDTDFIELFYNKLIRKLKGDIRTLQEIKELNSTYSYLKYVKEKLYYGFIACYDLIMVSVENNRLEEVEKANVIIPDATYIAHQMIETYNASLIEYWPPLEPQSKFYEEQKKYLETKKMKEEK